MTSPTPAKPSLTQLNREIEAAEAEAARFEVERANIGAEARRAARRRRYLHFVQKLRAPAAQFELWSMGVMLFGPLFIGVLALVVVSMITGSFPAAILSFLFAIVAGQSIISDGLHIVHGLGLF